MDVGLLSGGHNLMVWYSARVVSIRNVLSDGDIKEYGLLRHKTQLASNPAHIDGLDVLLIDILEVNDNS